MNFHNLLSLSNSRAFVPSWGIWVEDEGEGRGLAMKEFTDRISLRRWGWAAGVEGLGSYLQ